MSHRLPSLLESPPLPQPALPAVNPEHFVACPLVPSACCCPAQLWWQWSLYQWAFEQARQAARPSLPERDLLGVWN